MGQAGSRISGLASSLGRQAYQACLSSVSELSAFLHIHSAFAHPTRIPHDTRYGLLSYPAVILVRRATLDHPQ